MTPELVEVTIHSEQVNAIRLNDDKALNQFYQENFPLVEKYVLQNSGTPEQAKDIYQEAFVAVWRNIQTGRFKEQGGSSLTGYLFRIAKNKWLDHLRSAAHRNTVTLNDKQEELSGESIDYEAQDQQIRMLGKQFEKLGNNCRELLKRFYYHKESLNTIAKRFQWTDATARNNKYRCIQQLKELFNNHHE